jgi:hypothetical protein
MQRSTNASRSRKNGQKKAGIVGYFHPIKQPIGRDGAEPPCYRLAGDEAPAIDLPTRGASRLSREINDRLIHVSVTHQHRMALTTVRAWHFDFDVP